MFLFLYAVLGEHPVLAKETPDDVRTAAPYDYTAIDGHALNASPSVERSLDSLAAYLTAPAKNDREKVRAIFRWITSRVSYDAKSFLSGSRTDTTPEGVLRSRSAVCSGYAGLFQALAQRGGLECATIRGYAKGYGYAAGHTVGKVNHDWNAVNIDGSWYLLDSTWGAGSLSGKTFVQKFKEFFFLTPPEIMILSHFPVDTRWQLLQKPLSKAIFDCLAKPATDFFRLGLDWESLSHKDSLLRVKDRVDITLATGIPLEYMARLKKNGKDVPFSTFVETTGGKATIHAEFPDSGMYELLLFAKPAGMSGSDPELLSYSIQADGTAPEEPKGFPVAYGAFYSNGGELYSPKQGNLKNGEVYPFRVKIPGAKKVAVIVGKLFVFLKNTGNDVFEGTAKVSNESVMVSYNTGSSNNYIGILKYNVFQSGLQ